MYICSCNVVTDHDIKNAVKSGTKSWKELVKSTRVSTKCGTCKPSAKECFLKAKLARDLERKIARASEKECASRTRNSDTDATSTDSDTSGCACHQETATESTSVCAKEGNSNMTGKNILVIGSGVSGLTSSLMLLRAGHKVTIWSKEVAGEFPSTSYNAYAMWVPVKIDSDPRVERWTNETYCEFEKLSKDTATGVEMRKIIALKPEHSEPWYADSLSIFRHATAAELPAGYADGHVLESAPVIDPTVYLPWLHNEVLAAGGKFEQREIEEIAKCPAEFEVIINCSGLGARKLAADTGLFPERVQVVRVKPNGFSDVVIDDEGHNKRSCVVPHRDYIQIGAVFDGNNETLEIDDQHTQDILERCRRMLPGFKCDDSDVISVARALRPERSLTRVELDKLADGRTLVHNYGHDGMGYLISYGIAAEIAKYFDAL